HFERDGMRSEPQEQAAKSIIIVKRADRLRSAPLWFLRMSIDAYLDHLRVERRLADHTLESYARDLVALAAYAAGAGSSVEPLGLRDRALIELLYATGMRVTELVSVRIADLHLADHYLTCIGKGSKERLIPIGEQASDWVEKYQRTARGKLLKKRTSPRLFVN